MASPRHSGTREARMTCAVTLALNTATAALTPLSNCNAFRIRNSNVNFNSHVTAMILGGRA